MMNAAQLRIQKEWDAQRLELTRGQVRAIREGRKQDAEAFRFRQDELFGKMHAAMMAAEHAER